MKKWKITYKYDNSHKVESVVVRAETKETAAFDFRAKHKGAKIWGIKEV